MKNKNEEVFEFIRYYLQLSAPPYYAVMLTGPWGIGKTFALKSFLDQMQYSNGSYLYASLYGVSSREEIDLVLLKALFPLLNTPTGKILSGVGATAMKHLRLEVDVKGATKKLLEGKAPSIYIFDDLERCEMNSAEMLGYINQFVEHDGRKVILVANEEELSRLDENYLRTREKVIGRTFRVSSSSLAAVDKFIVRVSDPAIRDLLVELKPTILEVFEQSALGNLRLLQNAISDCSRVLKLVNSRNIKCSSGLHLLVRLMLIASFEVQSGRLPRSILENRSAAFAVTEGEASDDGAGQSLKRAAARYGLTNMYSDVLSDKLLCEFIDFGIVDGHELNEWLETCGHFGDGNVPSWRILWHSYVMPDAQLEAALQDFEAKFAARSIVDPGVILHVFGLRLWLVRESILDGSIESVTEDCKKYVDDLLSAGKMQPSADDSEFEFSWTGAHDGLGIFERETPAYKILYRHLQNARQLAQKRTDEQIASRVIGELRLDSVALRAKLWDRNAPSDSIAHRPILMHVNVAEFATAFLELDPDEQHSFVVALVGRLGAHRSNALEGELVWLSKLADELDACSESLPRFSRVRVRNRVNYLRSVQNEV